MCFIDKAFQYVAAKAFDKIMKINYFRDALKGSIKFYVRLSIISDFEDILLVKKEVDGEDDRLLTSGLSSLCATATPNRG
jgi:hypothetical protein